MNDKELIERLALEVAKNISFEHRAPLSDTSIITFATRLLAAYLAERGTEAVAWRVVRKIDDKPLLDWINGNGHDAVSIFEHGYIQRAFLTPQPDAELVKLLKDDAYAMTFQSIGQYRSALINAAGGQQCD